MEEENRDHYIETFMGTTYEIGRPETIGQLRRRLKDIASDLPEDPNLKVAEVHVHEGKITYTLVDGIAQ